MVKLVDFDTLYRRLEETKNKLCRAGDTKYEMGIDLSERIAIDLCHDFSACRLQAGDTVRHFKGNLYKILNVAVETTYGNTIVVYQALYGDNSVFVRPYEEFMSEVDLAKYPNVTQEYRFEKL